MAMSEGRRFLVRAITNKPIPVYRQLARMFDMAGVELRRLNSGTAPVTLIHNVWSFEMIVGHVVKDSAKVVKGELLAEIELLTAEELARNDHSVNVLDLIDLGVKNVSIGTRVYEIDAVETEMGTLTIARQWEPEEIALVPVGACWNARILKELTNE